MKYDHLVEMFLLEIGIHFSEFWSSACTLSWTQNRYIVTVRRNLAIIQTVKKNRASTIILKSPHTTKSRSVQCHCVYKPKHQSRARQGSHLKTETPQSHFNILSMNVYKTT